MNTQGRESVARLTGISRVYTMGEVEVPALADISLEIFQGEYISIMGPSGCGKSTLLNLLGCLDRPTAGAYYLQGEDVAQLSDDALSEVRGAWLGFIFQSYNLIPSLTVLENIEVPLYYQGVPAAESRERAAGLADRVGLGHRLEHKPFELSGGQQQRAGIARALVNDPLVILADEPTGNLDTKSGAEIMNVLEELHEQGKTLIMVTHDEAIGRHSPRVIRLLDGRIESDTRSG
jgi:putative ABC transport system ATP-binding protein